MSEKPLWNEDVDATPYYTDKPDWDAFHALLLYAVCKALRKPVPKTVDKGFDLAKQPSYQAFMRKKEGRLLPVRFGRLVAADPGQLHVPRLSADGG